MRLHIDDGGLKKLIKDLESIKTRITPAVRFVLLSIANKILEDIKLAIPNDNDLDKAYSDGLYLAEVDEQDRNKVTVAITVRPETWELSTGDFSKAAIMFYPQEGEEGTPSFLANEISNLWTADTLPSVTSGYNGKVVIRYGREDEIDFIRTSRNYGAALGSDTEILERRMAEAGYTIDQEYPLTFNNKPYIDLKFYALRMEFGDGARRPWRNVLQKVFKNDAAFMMYLNSDNIMAEAIRIINTGDFPADFSNINSDSISSKDAVKFIDFTKKVSPR